MPSLQVDEHTKTSKTNTGHILHVAIEICTKTREALGLVSGWERAAHIFWLLGPLILLIERSPADMWLSVIALSFAVRSILRREGWWLNVTWVRLAFLFWATCLISAFLSPLPAYSIGEAFVWFRFPLFAMAVAFWLGRDERMINAMLLSIGIGMMAMCVILAAEILIVAPIKGVCPALWRPGPGQLSCQGMFACIRSGGCNCHLEQRADSKLGSHHRPDFHCGFGHDRGTRQFSYSRLCACWLQSPGAPIVSRHRDFCR